MSSQDSNPSASDREPNDPEAPSTTGVFCSHCHDALEKDLEKQISELEDKLRQTARALRHQTYRAITAERQRDECRAHARKILRSAPRDESCEDAAGSCLNLRDLSRGGCDEEIMMR